MSFWEKFLNLAVEKQNIIIDAALKCFSDNGYKKASISDIATAAGISKAMVFHYFGTKKALYLYLVELCSNILTNEINEKFDNNVTDFFDKIKLSANIEISVIKKHPAILSFLNSVYFETDDEVKDDIKSILENGENIRRKIAFEGMDASSGMPFGAMVYGIILNRIDAHWTMLVAALLMVLFSVIFLISLSKIYNVKNSDISRR